MPGRLRSPPQLARELFAPIAPSYQRYARLLSMGQDPRWRRSMVGGLELPPGGKILDVASGTGSITRLLQSRGLEVVSVDQSEEMLAVAVAYGATGVLSTAERLPFPDGAFDGVTFGYLLRYVESVEGCLQELARVVRSGGVVGMVEFGRPAGVLRPAWWAYTRIVLPLTGAVIRSGWWEVGRFLGPSIDWFAQAHPPDVLAREWRAAGLEDIRIRRMSLGGGLIMWARKT
jgi:demethylmenaquinone methyltransferase / 2-methoxy-6-polyprenyl-1,4-benzoquinol methylase